MLWASNHSLKIAQLIRSLFGWNVKIKGFLEVRKMEWKFRLIA